MELIELLIKFQEGAPMTFGEKVMVGIILGILLEVWMHYGKKLAVYLARMEEHA